MADVKEKDLSSKTTLGVSDYLRVVGSDNVSYKQLVSDVAKCIVENYTGSTIAGSAQSIKSALDNLNSKLPSALRFDRFMADTSGYTVTFGNGYRGILFITDSNPANCAIYIVYSTGSGVVGLSTVKANSDTYDVGTTSKLKIKTASGSRTCLLVSVQASVSV